jgi:FAD/FMN-containing dehydrogenase
MADTLAPADADGLADAVRWAVAGEHPLEVVAGGSKRALGRPVQSAATLSLAAFDGIVDYQPSELVLTAGAATPLATIEAAVAAERQMLAFEPADYGPLLGAAEPATFEFQGRLGEASATFERVRGHNHGLASGLGIGQQVVDESLPLLIECGVGFVQEPEVARSQEQSGQAQALFHTAREGLDRSVFHSP